MVDIWIGMWSLAIGGGAVLIALGLRAIYRKGYDDGEDNQLMWRNLADGHECDTTTPPPDTEAAE